MLILAVHHIDRPDRLPLPDDFQPWMTDTHIGETYKRLSMLAVDEGWDHDMVIVQDDVRFTVDPESIPMTGELRVFGQTKRLNHVCPRAFSASPLGWKHLESEWLPAPNTLCHGFTQVVNSLGATVSEVTTHG